MNVLLINPSQEQLYGKFVVPEHPPIGLGYVGAMLERYGHRVTIVDIDADKITPDILLRRVVSEGIGLVGIMALTPTFNSALKTARLVKQGSGARVVFGGIHPTLMPEECLKHDEVDFVVMGEGEYTTVELVAALEEGRDPGSVRGLGFKRKGEMVINEARPFIDDLDEIPFPAIHLFSNTRYTYPDALESPTFPIITSRGCPGMCTYCSTRSIFTRRFRARGAKNIVDEVERLIKDYGAREIHIWDDNFVTIRKRVFEVRDEIKRRGISVRFAFPNGIRADFLNREVLMAMKDMGTYSIGLGIESGDEEVLRRVKKQISLDKVRETVKITKELGIETWGFFMLGLAGDTEETVKKTIDFAIELDTDIAKFHVLKPYPGTEIFEEFLNSGLIDDLDFSRYGIHTSPVHHLEGLSAEDITRLQNVAYKRFYFRPVKLIKQILRLTSFTRIRLNVVVALSLIRKVLGGKE